MASNTRSIRYVVATFSFLLLAVNGCEPVYFEANASRERLQAQEKRELRVLTLKDPLIYQKDSKGKASGIDHDLLEQFALEYGFDLKFIEKKDEAQLFDALAKNEGDLIAARLRADDVELKGFIAGPAYEETQLSLFCQSKAKVTGIDGLSGKTVALLEKDAISVNQSRLHLLAPQSDVQKIVNSNTHQILKMTSNGQFDCAFAETLEGDYYLRAYPHLEKVGPVTDQYTLNWILRPELQDLQNLMQHWIQHASRQDDIMRIHDRYRTFVNALNVQDVKRFTSRLKSALPAYEESFRAAARRYQLDWKLLAAISFQESHWEASATSYTGVKGIMQLTSTTAKLAGVEDRNDPHQSIWGGAYYFKYLLDRMPAELHPKDRLALALTAYNIGYGHLLDAQKLVLKKGRNPNSWRDIKSVLPHLSDPNYSSELDYGAARGFEAIDFVERVRGYYSLWQSLDT
jgi:membrane-bound lytic murein transglycosylase F